MRFRADVHNLSHLIKLTASLSTLGHIAWVRLDSTDIRFTVIPESGTQVWSVLVIDTLFENYVCQSAAENNTINLEVPLGVLHRALKSAVNASSANVRLTKKDGVPLLSLTITTEALRSSAAGSGRDGFAGTAANGDTDAHPSGTNNGVPQPTNSSDFPSESSGEFFPAARPERETVITQDIPVRVLALMSVEGLHEPRCREPDVHIVLPNLGQLKSISDRFTRLALSGKQARGATGFHGSSSTSASSSAGSNGPKLELSANMHGCLRLSLTTDPLSISSLWTGLENPELDPDQVAEGLEQHPSTLMKSRGDATGQHGEEG
ncbi:Checkpoint protein hus1, partial [Teratosphaeriaceae sp. CCFEE 6253]